MKILYLLHILIYAYLLYFGIECLDGQRAFVDEFNSTGKRNYYKLPNVEYSDVYTMVWFLVSIGTMLLSVILYVNEEKKYKGGVLGVLTIATLLTLWINSDESITRVYASFWFFGIFQIWMGLLFLFEELFIWFYKNKTKSFFLLIGFAYLGLLGLRFYLWDLESSILTGLSEVGWENYTGMGKSLPVEIYRCIALPFTFFTAILLFISFEEGDEDVPTFMLFIFMLLFSIAWGITPIETLNEEGAMTGEQLVYLVYISIVILYALGLSAMSKNKAPEIKKKENSDNSEALEDSFYQNIPILKPLYFVQILLYAYLIYLGLDYLEIETSLAEGLARTRWSAARDALEMETVLFYTNTWVLCSIGTLLFTGFLYKKGEIGKTLIVGGATLSILLMLGFNWLTEKTLSGSYIAFGLYASIQIGVNVLFLFERWIVPFVDRNLKQFFFFVGMLYIGILALRFYLLNFKNTILETIEEIGVENYTGVGVNILEDFYWFVIVFIGFFVFVLQMYSVDKDDNRLDKRVRSVLSGFRYALFFSCLLGKSGLDLISNDGGIVSSPLFGIGSLIFIIILAFMLSVKVKDKHSEILRRSDVLDDSFH
jgi:hypothetical protein